MKTFKEYLEDVKKNKKCPKCGGDTKVISDNNYGSRLQCQKCGYTFTIQKNPETGEYLEDVKTLDVDFQSAFVGAGKFIASGKSEDEFDPEEIAMGIKVEMEHTNNKDIAKRIALDHLSERPDYYSNGKAKGIFDELK